jgi:hypothetical protein
MTTAAGPPESDSKKLSNSRGTTNIEHGRQQQQQKFTIRTLVTEGGRQQRQYVGTSKTSTAEGRHTSAEMPATVETPTTVLESAWTPTATEMPETIRTPTTPEFLRKFAKNSSES